MTAAYLDSDLQSLADDRQTVAVRGRKRVDGPLVLTRDGSRVVFDGGLQNCLHFETSQLLGNTAALIGDGLLLDIQGAGACIEGGINLIGYTQETGPWGEIPHDKLPKLAVQIRGAGGEKGMPWGLDNGASHFGPMFIGGFQRGIQFGTGLDENNADNCTFARVFCSHIRNLICFKNRQSVSNTFWHIRQLADGTQAEQREFELLRFEAGGKCLVHHAEINNGLVCRAIRSDWNTGFCTVLRLSTDPGGGNAFRLFDGSPDKEISGTDNPCPFEFDIGRIWNGIDWREPVETAGWMIDAYAGQHVSINGGGLLEAKNGPSIRLRGTKAERATLAFNGVKFDSQSTPRELIHPSSEHYTVKWTDCRDRKGEFFSNKKSKE